MPLITKQTTYQNHNRLWRTFQSPDLLWTAFQALYLQHFEELVLHNTSQRSAATCCFIVLQLWKWVSVRLSTAPEIWWHNGALIPLRHSLALLRQNQPCAPKQLELSCTAGDVLVLMFQIGGPPPDGYLWRNFWSWCFLFHCLQCCYFRLLQIFSCKQFLNVFNCGK